MRAATLAVAACLLIGAASPPPPGYQSRLVDLERRYTFWSFAENPTSATDAGIHDYDTRLADFSAATQAAEMAQLRRYRSELVALQPPPGAGTHERVDYLLIRANLEGDWWGRAVLRSLQRNPSIYEGECTNGIFSIVKRRYASDDTRIRDAIARLKACPRVLEQGRANLTQPVREFAQIASEDIRDGDSLYTTTLDEVAKEASPAARADLPAAQRIALDALQGTPLLPWYLRLLGARIGRRVYVHSTGFLEFDLVEIGDRAVLNNGCILQTHLFEDRILKASKLRIGANCEIGAHSIVLYGAEMNDGSRLGALSLLMKGESLPAGTEWVGSPLTAPLACATGG